ncbi:MAG: AAA family ATPase, partial [Pseudomonadota bacterium]
MHITRLRLLGFKSFVDATELVVAPGLTGVVGPNGCGKSNLTEAINWVLGEQSANQYRDMDMSVDSGGIEVARSDERMFEFQRRITSAK